MTTSLWVRTDDGGLVRADQIVAARPSPDGVTVSVMGTPEDRLVTGGGADQDATITNLADSLLLCLHHLSHPVQRCGVVAWNGVGFGLDVGWSRR